uniref:Cadherin domain-containing protein n=1 Tax=Knipowitschia caucasica TaxID=637954 RepID=A0AAV2LAW1_KNICA
MSFSTAVCRGGAGVTGKMGPSWEKTLNPQPPQNSDHPLRRRRRRERYAIDKRSEGARAFRIDPHNGTVSLATALDRESLDWHNVTVTATETKSP